MAKQGRARRDPDTVRQIVVRAGQIVGEFLDDHVRAVMAGDCPPLNCETLQAYKDIASAATYLKHLDECERDED